jgi:23S rRNA (pseudouridine1915-N3)-methyltransferase
MKISVINLGTIKEAYLKEGMLNYEKRIKRYVSFEVTNLNEPKHVSKQSAKVQKENEGKVILASLVKIDMPVLLDVSGKKLSSEGFADYIQQMMNKGVKNLGFITGGSYGFSGEVYKAVPESISLSEMTFSHQLVRLIFLEQLYRAFTIIKGEPYHHI